MSSTKMKILLAGFVAGLTSAAPWIASVTRTTSMSTSTTAAAGAPPAVNTALIQSLKLAGTEVDRLEILLPKPENSTNIVHIFRNATVTPPVGGTIALANIDNFPALVGTDLAVAVGFINACGLNTPHTHPRATEFLTVVAGELLSGFILENGFEAVKGVVPQVSTHLVALQGTLFPKGSIHFQFNPTCEPAMFVSALDSNDPGVSQVAQNFFNLDADIVKATLGNPRELNGEDIETFRRFIPANVAEGIETCLAKCHIAKK